MLRGRKLCKSKHSVARQNWRVVWLIPNLQCYSLLIFQAANLIFRLCHSLIRKIWLWLCHDYSDNFQYEIQESISKYKAHVLVFLENTYPSSWSYTRNSIWRTSSWLSSSWYQISTNFDFPIKLYKLSFKDVQKFNSKGNFNLAKLPLA